MTLAAPTNLRKRPVDDQRRKARDSMEEAWLEIVKKERAAYWRKVKAKKKAKKKARKP